MAQTLVLGGPGCGKTTKLLDLLEEVLNSGVPPNEVGFLAFTRKAAHEARERAAVRFGLTEADLPYFKTLHALAFAQLGLITSEVMGKNDYATIGKALGWKGTTEPDEDAGFSSASEDSMGRIAFVEQISRLSGEDLAMVASRAGDVRYYDALLYSDCLKAYKASRHALDFTDMLSTFLASGPFPSLKVVFIDEAQDLSPIQWTLVKKICEGAEDVYIGGDDDQAIYEWSGADVGQFLRLEGRKIVLPKSHRLPSNIFIQGERILSRILRRFPKNWTYASEGGRVDFSSSVDYVQHAEGSWMYLARNRYMLSTFTEFLREQGRPFWLLGRSSIDNDTVKSILCWESLRKGKMQPGKLVTTMLGYLRSGHGVSNKLSVEPELSINDLPNLAIPHTEDWMTVIRMTDRDRDYYRSILRNGESLIKPPSITVSTIHQVKGGEADHVVLSSDMSYKCYTSLQSNPDSEHRVFYVGATRAKKSLHIIYPTTNKFYEV